MEEKLNKKHCVYLINFYLFSAIIAFIIQKFAKSRMCLNERLEDTFNYTK